ncbi:MAG: NUDIX hydrolase [Candidatus Omnitrophota bacterium]|nr:NUDIX hydrolase [Candidatus Omnitrophota bacterium]
MDDTPKTRLAAGGVLVRRSRGQHEVCLTLRHRHGPAWGLPKGHLEDGEETTAAALREVREETGLTAVILEPLGSITYQFSVPGQSVPVTKTVTFYLMAATGGRVELHDQETVEARWMPFDAAASSVAHDDERSVLERAQQMAARPDVARRIPDDPAP